MIDLKIELRINSQCLGRWDSLLGVFPRRKVRVIFFLFYIISSLNFFVKFGVFETACYRQ